MPQVGRIPPTQVTVQNKSRPGATFSKDLPGVSGSEILAVLQELVVRKKKEADDNGIKYEIQGNTVHISGKAYGLSMRASLAISDGKIIATIHEYPAFGKDRADKRITDILNDAPEKIEEYRKRANGKTAWGPKDDGASTA